MSNFTSSTGESSPTLPPPKLYTLHNPPAASSSDASSFDPSFKYNNEIPIVIDNGPSLQPLQQAEALTPLSRLLANPRRFRPRSHAAPDLPAHRLTVPRPQNGAQVHV